MSLAANLESYFRREYSIPEEFKFFRWECLPHDGPTIYYELEGGIVREFYKSGPRKGEPKYSTATDRQTFRMTKRAYDMEFKVEVSK